MAGWISGGFFYVTMSCNPFIEHKECDTNSPPHPYNKASFFEIGGNVTMIINFIHFIEIVGGDEYFDSLVRRRMDEIAAFETSEAVNKMLDGMRLDEDLVSGTVFDHHANMSMNEARHSVRHGLKQYSPTLPISDSRVLKAIVASKIPDMVGEKYCDELPGVSLFGGKVGVFTFDFCEKNGDMNFTCSKLTDTLTIYFPTTQPATT